MNRCDAWIFSVKPRASAVASSQDKRSRLAACTRRVGEGAGQPGLARLCCSVYRFDETGCPAWPSCARPPTGGPAFGPLTDRTSRLATTDAGRTWRRGRRRQQPAPEGARRASRGHPSTSARTPELSFARASSLDHSPPTSRNVGSDALPTDGMGSIVGGVLPMAGRSARESAMCLERRGNVF